MATKRHLLLPWDSGLLCLYKQQILFLPPEHTHFHSQRFFFRLELSIMKVNCVPRGKSVVDACKPPPPLSPPSLYKTAPSVSSHKHGQSLQFTSLHIHTLLLSACLSLPLFLSLSISHTYDLSHTLRNLGSPVCVDRWLMSLWMLRKWFTAQRESELCMMMSWWVQRCPPQGSLGNCSYE